MAFVYQKGFNPTLFDCIDKAITSILGREAILTIYYAIQVSYNLPEEEFAKRPSEVILHLKAFLGEAGFRVLEEGIKMEIKETFRIGQLPNPFECSQFIDLAKRNYLSTQS